MAIVLVGWSVLVLAACGGGDATDEAAEAEAAPAEATVETADASMAGDGIVCNQLGVANYVGTFSSCSDQQIRVLFCTQSGPEGYECECKEGAMGEEELLDTVTFENTTPFERVDDIQALHGNVTSAAQDICGFEIVHPCDGTS